MADYEAHDQHGNCIFCKIVAGEFPPLGNGLFREDNNYMAWLSPFPNTKWFSVVIPKKHYGSDCLEMSDNDLTDFVLAAKKAAALLKQAMPDVGRVGLMMEGTGVDHAHIKLFPMHNTKGLNEGKREQHHSWVDTYFDTYEGYMMSNDGPRADDEELRELVELIKGSK